MDNGHGAATVLAVTLVEEQVSWQAECLGAVAAAVGGAGGAGDPWPGTGRGAHRLGGAVQIKRFHALAKQNYK